MFRFIFRTITLTIFTIILIAGIAVWKGGEPFRWLGKKTEDVGKMIIEFGDIVDELKGKKQKVEKTYKELKEGVFSRQDEDADKSRESE